MPMSSQRMTRQHLALLNISSHDQHQLDENFAIDQEVWFNLICVRLISSGNNDQFSTKKSCCLPLCPNVFSLGPLQLIHKYSHLNLSKFIDKMYGRLKTEDCRCYIILQAQSSYSDDQIMGDEREQTLFALLLTLNRWLPPSTEHSSQRSNLQL